MHTELHIAGIIVHSYPEQVATVASALSSLRGAQLHAVAEDRLVVTLEANSAVAIAEQMGLIENLTGVRSCALVYQHNEPFEAMMEELRHADNAP